MELDLREVGLSHLKNIVGIGKKYVATVAVNSHKLMLAFLECGKCLGIIALDPARLV